MTLFKVLISVIRRVRSVILLSVTISLLFYYTFKNEIDMLNSFAENEFIPSSNTHPATNKQLVTTKDTKDLITNDETSISDLSDPKVLREKNKYFPLLLQDSSRDPSILLGETNKFDVSALMSYKEKHPVLNVMSLPLSFSYMSKNYPTIQANKHSASGPQQNDILSKIRRVFTRTWAVDVLSNVDSGDDNHNWPITLIDTMDTLYIMGLNEEFQQAVEIVEKIDFTVPSESVDVIDIPDYGSRLLGGLISAYDLSQNTILLTKAIEVADFLLRSFDTPNRIPLLQYEWRSKTNNKFPYQNSYSGGFTSMSLELLRLAQITRAGKYFDAVQRLFKTFAMSSHEFSLPYMFPITVDASGCSVISNEDVLSGKHLRDSKGMKSIEQSLHFVHCHQTDKLLKTVSQQSGQPEIFKMNAPELSLYGNMVKSLHLLNGNDLLSAYADTTNEEVGRDSDSKMDPIELSAKDKQSSNKQITVKNIVENSMDEVIDYMAFTPLTPVSKSLTLITSVKTRTEWIPATHQFNVEVSKGFNMHHERCSLASIFALSSKFISSDTYMPFAINLTSSCFELFKLSQGMYLDDLFLDSCEDQQCSFDISEKIDRLSSGFYKPRKGRYTRKEDGSSIVLDKEINKDNAVNRVISFSKYGETPNLNLDLNDINQATTEWKNDPSIPLWVNGKGQEHILSSSLIESVFYMYRFTGDPSWRQLGQVIFKTTMDNLYKLNSGPKGVWKVRELHEDPQGQYVSEWYSRTMKYFYLLFADANDYSLDDYVFTSGGHLLKREPKVKKQ